MVPVEFKLDKGTDYYVHLDVCCRVMPWLDYLYKNCYDLEIKDIFDHNTYQHHVRFCFYLEPKKETFYKLKYR